MAGEVEGVVYRADAFLEVGQVDRAETIVRDALGQWPGDAALLLALAKVMEARRLWPEVVETATAALEADPNSLTARMMIAWAAHRTGDRDLMKQHLDVVLHHRPDHPTALMYLALHSTADRSSAGKTRTRELVARSLQNGDGRPWFTVVAANIEVSLGRSAEARRLVDDGLAQYPTDESLLKLKADLVSTSADESLGIVGNLLAMSPADASLRFRYDSLVAGRRRTLLTMLWLAPALVALGIGFLDGGLRVAWLLAVAFAAFSYWGLRTKTYGALPAGYRAQLDSSAPWRVATRVGGRSSALLTVIGGVILAAGAALGAWLLIAAALGWVVTRFASFAHERRTSAAADAETDTPAHEADGGETTRPWGQATRSLARDRWRRALTTPLLLIPFFIVGILPLGASPGAAGAALGAVGVIAVIVALQSQIEAAPWALRLVPRRDYVWLLLRVAIVGVVLLGTLVGSAVNLVSGTTGSSNGDPSAPLEEPTTPATVPPDFFDRDSPSPIPTFDFPDIDIPDIDIPTTPPVDPEGTGLP